jgi:excisionase family DNA binding protein
MTEKGLMRPRKAGKILDVSPRTVVRWIREGKIEGVKVGRNWRVPRSEVERVQRDGI